MVRESISIYYISNLSSGPGDLDLEELKGEVIQINDEHTVVIKITDLLTCRSEIFQVGDSVTIKSRLVLSSLYNHPDYNAPSEDYKIKEGDTIRFYVSKISDVDNLIITTNDYLTLVE